MVATAVTLNDLEGHSPVADVFTCNPSNTCAAFYMISTDSQTVCSHGSSAIAEPLVLTFFYAMVTSVRCTLLNHVNHVYRQTLDPLYCQIPEQQT